jgi:hypothetical protein
VLADTNSNFIEELSREENKIFRKRMIESILATDMGKHST